TRLNSGNFVVGRIRREIVTGVLADRNLVIRRTCRGDLLRKPFYVEAVDQTIPLFDIHGDVMSLRLPVGEVVTHKAPLRGPHPIRPVGDWAVLSEKDDCTGDESDETKPLFLVPADG